MPANNELENMWKEVVLSWHLLQHTQKNHENIGQDSRILDQISTKHIPN
jgi:hypothetical protein